MKKRLISIAVVLSIIASLFTFNIYSSAATSYVSPNMAILENILYGDRQFVIDTLIGTNYKTDFSTNPHALVNNIGNENAMMDNLLEQYRNTDNPEFNLAYSFAVDIMEKVYNGDDYVQHATDWVSSFAADLASIFSSDAQTVMDDLTYSVGELQYESILKEVLATDYTSSDGTTLSTKEIELENLERLDKGLKNLKDFASFFKADASANHMNDDTFDDRMDYYNKFLIPYTDSVESVLGSFADIQGTDDAEDLAAFITALAMVSQMDRFESANAEISSDIVYYAPTFFVDDGTLGIVKSASSSISTVSKTLSTYMFINSIGTQKEAVGDTLTRMSDNSKNTQLNSILNTFADEVGEAGNAKLMGYETLMQYLRNAGAVNEFGDWAIDKVSGKVSPYVEKFICENLDMAWEYSNAGLAKTAASTVLAKSVNVVEIAAWCADKTMSFGDVCKKTYELKYLEKIIKVAVDTYNKDVQTYLANKTEENAENVLDDLLMIQKLRLRGETVAYKMIEGQWDSPLCRLLSSGTLNRDESLISYLGTVYQYRVDALIGASAMPFTSNSLTVNKGERLTIYYEDAKGGLYGILTTADNTRGIGELEYRVAGGIYVNNGGEVLMSNNIPNAYIPYIVNNGGLVQFAGSTSISEYTQNSGTTTLGANTSYINSLHLNGGTLKSAHRDNLACKYFDNSSGTVTLEIPIYCENLSVKGTINGSTIYLKGDSTGGGGVIQNLCVSGSDTQNLSGALNITNLVYNNTGTANQPGTIYVSGTVKNTSSKVTNGQNTTLKSTGSIIGDHYNSGLTLDGITLDRAMTFGGTLKTLNTVNLDDVSITGGLTQSSGTLNLNGDVTVTADSYFGGTVTQNENTYYSDGDITVNGTNTFNNIITQGKLQQNINGTLNTTNFTNTNPKGVKVSNTVNVSGTLTNTYGKTSGIGMTLLSGGKFGSNTYQGDVTIQSSCDLPSKLTGNVIVSATNTIKQDTDIGGYLTVNSGNLTLENAKLNVDGKFTLSVPLTTDESSSVICNSGFTNSNTITGNSTPIAVKGILQNSSTINNCLITANKEFVNSGTISGGSITTPHDIYNNGTIDIDDLSLSSASLTEISGNSISTDNLTLNGKGKINLKTNINVADTYSNNGVTVDDTKIIISSGRVITSNKTYSTLNQTTDLIIDGCTVAVDTANITAGIKLINGAKLVINKRLTASVSSKTIEIDETSSLTVKKLASISSYSDIIVNGELTLGSDAVMNSTKLSGSGTINIKGDLYGSSLTVNKPENVNIIGKTPQIISCSGANFNNLNLLNNSRKGITFSSSVNCYGEYNKNDSNVSGTVTQK